MKFSKQGIYKGFQAGLPIALGVASYGFVFGILSRGAGLNLIESLSMSLFVFAGASQFIALEMWVSPLPVFAIIFTTFVVNLRHILMGATLADRFKGMTGLQKYGSLFFLVDESWAYSMNEWKQGSTNAGLLAGTGIALFIAWAAATAAGSLAGSGSIDPVRWGMDFSFTAIFIFIATGLWRGRKDAIPWIVAAAAAVLTSNFLPGKWYILTGGFAGSITGVLLHDTSD